MKKHISVWIILSMLCLGGCSTQQTKTATADNQLTVTDVIEDLAKAQEAENSEEETEAQTDTAPVESDSGVRLMGYSGDVDIDLTDLNANMIYSEVFNMMADPDSYIGRTVRIYGMYTHHYEESRDMHYYACIVRDAAACCASGLEFDLVDDYVWPDDYPEEGDEVVVTGDFNVYMDGYFKVLVLDNAVIEKHTPKA